MSNLTPTVYETDALLCQYLLLHFAKPEEVLTWDFGPKESLNFPVRCAEKCLSLSEGAPERRRALDLGCAVGRSTFELSRHYDSVLGIDYSHQFIDAALEMKAEGSMDYERLDEGDITTPLTAFLPEGVNPGRVDFEQGDACDLREDLGTFDLILMANLVCRLPDPMKLIDRLPKLVAPRGLIVFTTPFTWMEEFTPKEKWLGGTPIDGKPNPSKEAFTDALNGSFKLIHDEEVPFFIREHARKNQWSVAWLSAWHRV